MPSALSDHGQEAIERTLDDLASGAVSFRAEAPVPLRRSWWPLAIGMPAAAAAAFAVALWLPRPALLERTAADQVPQTSPVAAPSVGTPRGAKHDPGEIQDMPTKIFDTARRTAELEWRDGSLMLVFQGDTPHVKITSADGDTIYDGSLDSGDVPEPWKKRADLLKRDLLKRIEALPPAVE